VHHVQSAENLRFDWFDSEDMVGITAGTSTPDALIAEVEGWLRRLNERLAGSLRAPIAETPQPPTSVPLLH
jgi:4-hydroxy-3-methylbut-2-enyl diphosphate reductase